MWLCSSVVGRLHRGHPMRKFYYRCRNAIFLFLIVLFVRFKCLFLNTKNNVSVRIRELKFQTSGNSKKEILSTEFTSCCCLSENANGPFFRTQEDTFISPKKQNKKTGITFPISRKFELKKYSSFSSHFNPKIVGDYRCFRTDIHRNGRLCAPET